MAQYALPFVATPLFVLNSKFDACQMAGCELNLPDANAGWAKCSAAERAAAVAFSHNFSASLTATGVFWSGVPHGGWLSSCWVHCDAGDAAWTRSLAPPAPGVPGAAQSPSQAFAQWLAGSAQVWYVDTADAPDVNPTCM